MSEGEKKVDHEWKKRAKEEKAKLADAAPEGVHGEPPDASFAMIVSSLVAQTLIALGSIESPVDGQRTRDLEAAKFSIDLLQVLADKTKGNLTDEEKAMTDGALYDLRMRYVQAS